jgi:hypothetical protein
LRSECRERSHHRWKQRHPATRVEMRLRKRLARDCQMQ